MHGVAWRGTEVNVRRVGGFYLGSETPRRGSRDSFRLETRCLVGYTYCQCATRVRGACRHLFLCGR